MANINPKIRMKNVAKTTIIKKLLKPQTSFPPNLYMQKYASLKSMICDKI